jgi:hypothetical protein
LAAMVSLRQCSRVPAKEIQMKKQNGAEKHTFFGIPYIFLYACLRV